MRILSTNGATHLDLNHHLLSRGPRPTYSQQIYLTEQQIYLTGENRSLTTPTKVTSQTKQTGRIFSPANKPTKVELGGQHKWSTSGRWRDLL